MGREIQNVAVEKQSQLEEKTVREAASALLAFHKKKAEDGSEGLFLNQSSQLKLIISLWKITGKKAKTYRIKLPHPLRTPETEICLFTKDDNKVDSEETARKYQELLQKKGVTEVNEVMPLQVLKKEFKAFESRRQLSKRYDIFLADERIFRLMHAHLGKEFYRRKKYPVTVSLMKNDLRGEILQAIDATYFILTNRGNTNHLAAGHTGMTLDQVVENIMAAVQGVAAVVPHGWSNIKSLYVRTDESVSLPLHTSLVFKTWETDPAVPHGDIWRLKKQLNVTGEGQAKPPISPETDAKAQRFAKRAQRKADRDAKGATKLAARAASEAVLASTVGGAATKAAKRKATAAIAGDESSASKVETAAKKILKEKPRVATGAKKAKGKTPGRRQAKGKAAKKAKTK